MLYVKLIYTFAASVVSKRFFFFCAVYSKSFASVGQRLTCIYIIIIRNRGFVCCKKTCCNTNICKSLCRTGSYILFLELSELWLCELCWSLYKDGRWWSAGDLSGWKENAFNKTVLGFCHNCGQQSQ